MIQLLLTAAAITTIATISSTYIVARITLLLTTVTVLLTTTTIDNYNNVNDNTVNTTFPCMIFFVGVCPFSFPLLFFLYVTFPGSNIRLAFSHPTNHCWHSSAPNNSFVSA